MKTVLPTLNEWLERAAGYPDAGVRFVDRRERANWVPWSEIRERAQRVCGALQRHGLAPGDRVTIVFPTGPSFFDAFFGTLLAGAVPVPLYPPVRLGRLDEFRQRTARMIELVNARLVLSEPAHRQVLQEAVASLDRTPECHALEELEPGRARPVTTGPADLALVQFSSGTTSEPKPVGLTHRALAAQTLLLNGYWPDEDGLRHTGVSWLPLYHDMGLVGCVFPALERPSQITLIRPDVFVGRPSIWLRTISRYGATISPAPNFAYGVCVSRIRDEEMEDVDLAAWRVALNGAEMVVGSVMRAFQDRFARWGFRPEALTPVYGMSETALAATFSDPERVFVSRRFDRNRLAARGEAVEVAHGREIVSVGRPVTGFELRVVDRDGDERPEERVGRVLIKGPSLMDGYLDQPGATAQAMVDGWLDSGDVGFLRDGELYLTGRAKDVLLLRGQNHAPEEVEHAVREVDGVHPDSAVAVSHLPEDAESERLLLFLEVGRRPRPGDAARIVEAAREAVIGASGLSPDEVVVLGRGSLPRTSSGKLRRHETLRLFLAGELQLAVGGGVGTRQSSPGALENPGASFE